MNGIKPGMEDIRPK